MKLWCYGFGRNPDDGNSRSSRNGSTYLPDYTISHHKNHYLKFNTRKFFDTLSTSLCKNVPQHVCTGTQFFITFLIFSIHAIPVFWQRPTACLIITHTRLCSQFKSICMASVHFEWLCIEHNELYNVTKTKNADKKC